MKTTVLTLAFAAPIILTPAIIGPAAVASISSITAPADLEFSPASTSLPSITPNSYRRYAQSQRYQNCVRSCHAGWQCNPNAREASRECLEGRQACIEGCSEQK
jgi:hypothetical protein